LASGKSVSRDVVKLLYPCGAAIIAALNAMFADNSHIVTLRRKANGHHLLIAFESQ
jgi:hypothetical protein